MNHKDVDAMVVERIIPTGWNLYEWCERHPGTVVDAAVRRLEKIFDFSDVLQASFSGGKDSSITANLACAELLRRKLRVQHGVTREGVPGVDPLDAKWACKRVHMCMTDAEVCFTSTNDYAKRFLAKYGPEGLDLVEFNWICLPMAWQSGVSFDSGILISWDPAKMDMWVQPMPDRKQLHGFDCVHMDNLREANPVPLRSLPIWAQEYHKSQGDVIHVRPDQLFHPDSWEGLRVDANGTVQAVCNWGRGPYLPNFKMACHEKEEQDDYSYGFAQSAWLLDGRTEGDIQACKRRLAELYDLSRDVWFLTAPEVDGEGVPESRKRVSVPTALVSLRAEESLDRRVILSQGEWSTGQYSRNQGTNICSPVFDWKAEDVWRVFSATDWDVNDVYEKLYEIGVGIGDQRVGSLLNYAAVRQIATVKALEPDLYGRINQRFANVEFMAQFSRSSYFRISKPKDAHWDGKNHLKAGVPEAEITALSDEYERVLQQIGEPYRREGNEFWADAEGKRGKPWFPIRDWLEAHDAV